MRLSIRDQNVIFRKGKRAALEAHGAFTCPYVDDDARFAAWIEGYESGEIELDRKQKNSASAPLMEYWSAIKPLDRS